ncbi:hypothetical protein D9M71_690380 [compost metagenome]
MQMGEQAGKFVVTSIQGEPQHTAAIVQPLLAVLLEQRGLAEAGGGAHQHQAGGVLRGQKLQQVLAGQNFGLRGRYLQFSRIDPRPCLGWRLWYRRDTQGGRPDQAHQQIGTSGHAISR